MDLRESLMYHRRMKGMLQKELAEKSGVSAATISRVESGEVKQLGSEALQKLAAALEITVDRLLRGRSSVTSIRERASLDDLPDDVFSEVVEFLQSYQTLSPQRREQVRLFARFLAEQEQREHLPREEWAPPHPVE